MYTADWAESWAETVRAEERDSDNFKSTGTCVCVFAMLCVVISGDVL